MRRKWFLALVLLIPCGAYGYYHLRSSSTQSDDKPIVEVKVVSGDTQSKLTDDEESIRQMVAILPVLPGQPFPSLLAWEPLRVIGQKKARSLEDLLKQRPIEFLEVSLRRYEQQIQGYQLIFLKRERINGKLLDWEKLSIHFREEPFSVHMHWLEGARLASKSLYVKGQNDGRLLARPNLPFLPIMTRDINGPEAKRSGRFTIEDFGLYKATQRTLGSMRLAEKAGTLHLTYEGVVRLEQTGINRACHKLVRKPYVPAEEDDLCELTMYFDQETLLQVGSVLRDSKNNLIAEYFFRDVEINPTFEPQQFTRAGL